MPGAGCWSGVSSIKGRGRCEGHGRTAHAAAHVRTYAGEVQKDGKRERAGATWRLGRCQAAYIYACGGASPPLHLHRACLPVMNLVCAAITSAACMHPPAPCLALQHVRPCTNTATSPGHIHHQPRMATPAAPATQGAKPSRHNINPDASALAHFITFPAKRRLPAPLVLSPPPPPARHSRWTLFPSRATMTTTLHIIPYASALAHSMTWPVKRRLPARRLPHLCAVCGLCAHLGLL